MKNLDNYCNNFANFHYENHEFKFMVIEKTSDYSIKLRKEIRSIFRNSSGN